MLLLNLLLYTLKLEEISKQSPLMYKVMHGKVYTSWDVEPMNIHEILHSLILNYMLIYG